MDGRIKEEYVLQYREGEKYNSHQTVQKKISYDEQNQQYLSNTS